MLLEAESLLLLSLLFFFIAMLYASAGFGGGSSYLALLSLFITSFFTIRSIALLCNIIVVSGSSYFYFKQGHARLKEMLPFVITSVPMAFLGASFRFEEAVFFIILGIALTSSSLLLIWQSSRKERREEMAVYPAWLNYFIGGGIGLLSGLVGIGGGVFLAPLLNHLRFDKPIKIASLASFFILVNSISGLGGMMASQTIHLPLEETLLLVAAVFMGGQLGARIGLKSFSPNTIKRVTALIVFIVGIRAFLFNGLQIG